MSEDQSPKILIGGNEQTQVWMPTAMANRHGMIAGATGTGKTVSLQILAESFSKLGVPCFMADVKGDLSGLAKAGKAHPKIQQRVDVIGIEDYSFNASPTVFWDLFGNKGHMIRATITDLGPLLISSLLELNDTQTGVLYGAFKIADDNGMLLLDLKDLQALLKWMGENRKELMIEYGNIHPSSLGAIQRSLMVLEEQNAEYFLGEPAITLSDLMQHDFSGRGVISILDVTKLISRSPRLYATFLLWLLSELFEELPEVGDADKPKAVFFFDEAHLLFDRAPKALVDKIEQVVRLIRSKGVGIYFISQSPLDIPEEVLGQLGLKIQHALRAFTPKDKKAVETVAETFRINPEIDTMTAITELGTGEALVSVLDLEGAPTPVERILVRPPESQIGPITQKLRKEIIGRSPLKGKYDQTVDRDSAYEMLKKQAEQTQQREKKAGADRTFKEPFPSTKKSTSKSRYKRQTATEAFIKSAARSIGSQVGRRVIRGILGSLLGGRR